MIVCFVILRASGRGGFCGWSDFGPGFGPAGVNVGLVGACVIVVIGLSAFCLPWHRRVTGINAEVAEAYGMGAFVEA